MATKALKSQGTLIEVKDASDAFVEVKEMTTFDGPGGTATVIDATHLQSVAKEKLMGLPDEGQFTLAGNYIPDDAGQGICRAKRLAQEKASFRVTFTDASTAEFEGYVLGFSISGGVDDKINASMTIEITGEVTWA